jgi:hypothetical protein
MRRSLIVTITAVASVLAVKASGVSASQVSPVDLIGSVKAGVSLPPGQQRPHRTTKPVQAIVSVTITSEAGSRVLKEMVFTNTKFALWVPAGRYSVSAEIGPPTVGRPRQCGKTRLGLVVAKGKQTSFNLECVLR